MKFITLHIWDSARYLTSSQHKKPVIVNPEKIVTMNAQTSTYLETEEHRRIPSKDRPQEDCTYIHFGAGYEDSDGVYVCETPEEIIREIGYCEQADLEWKLQIEKVYRERNF